MLGGWPAGGIWLSAEPADLRRSFDGLCALVATHLGENLEHADRADARAGLKNRHNFGFEDIGQRVWAAPAPRLLLWRRLRTGGKPVARLKPALAAATSVVSVFFRVMNSLFCRSVM